ncbi:glycosyltransferase involved in cell wall biosynthesis [Pontibacter ummariensis]|uniref:Glycosyltransferase involved in cell wall bisynthesis n=2 Tax=Pontibacter ummariensis TaxID=1610492 RepID=A0A239FEZ1_9BACT|nr:glycosyltransferase involved in cell wall biosynthesis [Pontibacter ummariensis]SNS54644.1 Glycosyltransferase involved in cell wall bisynthesis [Pontibacter ummariensis]
MNQHEHVVIHGERKDEISAEDVKAKFPQHVSFLKWKSAHRSISIVKDLKALADLRRKLKQLKPDVVHLHSSKAGFLGRLACNALGIRNVVFTPHGAAFLRKDTSFVRVLFYAALEKSAALLSGTVVCCSKSEAEKFRKVGVKATYINNGIVLPAGSLRATERKASPVPKFTIVTCGRITEQKNPVLFNDIASAFAQDSSIRFVWIGDGEYRDKLISNNITVTGWKGREEVVAEVNSADVYLSTSSWEGLPFSVLEAMSLGKCLVLSNCVGNIDLVAPDYNGFTFDTAEEAVYRIGWLKSNRKILDQMGMNSLEMCYENFNIEDTFKKYLSIYQDHNAVS